MARSTGGHERCLLVRRVPPQYCNRRRHRFTGAPDASSEGWRGVVRSPLVSSKIFLVAEFLPDLAHVHISIKDTFALHKVLGLLVNDQPGYLRGRTATINVGNTPMCDSVRKGRAKDEHMRGIICQLFML